jgi:hypothetical protein
LPMQKTKAISNKPAMIKTIQLIISLEKGHHQIIPCGHLVGTPAIEPPRAGQPRR